MEDFKPPLHSGTGTASQESARASFVTEPGLCKFGCGCRVQPGTTRSGKPFDTCCRSCAVSPAAGVHDPKCLGPPDGSAAASSMLARSGGGGYRPVCSKGARCRQRYPGHLMSEAHPLDKDYHECCKAAGVEAEEMSLKVLFDWADADGSGKLTRQELSATLDVINRLAGLAGNSAESGDMPEISEEAWHHLDEDGNGLVNFNEFASWAGPRLGLPLGVKKMIHRSASQQMASAPCGVFNCPCEAFVPMDKKGKTCKTCKHKLACHVTRTSDAEVPAPEYWDNHQEKFNSLVKLGALASSEFQQLFDKTYKNIWTRDRTRHNENKTVPKGFQVVSVTRNENSGNWQEYSVRRAELLTRLKEAADEGQGPLARIDNVKTTVAWKAIGGAKADRLAHECNEWYLFHGTNPEAAKSICTTDFKVSFAGGNTGTLYGRGLYFAESITKSDEYAKPNSAGVYAVLLCRILGGKVRTTEEVTPDPEELVQSVTEGPYDTILGDREKCKGTYREFVIFDTEDVYPEYLIEYKRVY